MPSLQIPNKGTVVYFVSNIKLHFDASILTE